MTPQIQVFNYEDQPIEFELITGKKMMTNATEMAKVFGREIKHFNDLNSTKSFIESCLISRNSRLIDIEKKEDLIISKQKSDSRTKLSV